MMMYQRKRTVKLVGSLNLICNLKFLLVIIKPEKNINALMQNNFIKYLACSLSLDVNIPEKNTRSIEIESNCCLCFLYILS